MTAIVRLHHVQITVPRGAEEDARRFYCGLLGLREVAKPPALAERGGFWLEAGASQVHIGVEDGVDRARSKAHLAYEVDDLAAWRARLGTAGVATLDGIQITGWQRCEMRDPFGNRVELMQAER